MTGAAATNVFGIIVDGASSYFESHGSANAGAILGVLSGDLEEVKASLASNPTLEVAAATAGLIAVAALGPTVTVATAVDSAALYMEPLLAEFSPSLVGYANQLATVLVNYVVGWSAQTLYVNLTEILGSIATNLGGALTAISVSGSTGLVPSNSSTNTNLIIAAAPDSSGNTSELLVNLPVPTQDSGSLAVVTQNTSNAAPGTPGYKTDQYTGSTITFLGNDDNYHTANVLYLNSSGTAYVVDNVSGEGPGGTTVGVGLVTKLVGPSGSVPEVLGSQVTNNSDGSQTLNNFGTNGDVQYTDSSNTTSSGTISDTITGQGDINTLSNAAVNLAAGAAATVAGSAVAIAAAAGSSVTIDGPSDTVSTTSAGSTVGNNTVTFVASTENVSLPLTIGIDVATGQQVSVTGTDGTMTINNNSTGNGSISNTLDFSGGSSEIQQFSGLPSGEKELDTGYTGTNGTGTQTYQQTDTLSGSQLNVTITGTGDTCDLSNVTITLSNGASCTVTGTNDTVALGSNDTVTITGASDSASITGNSSTVNESGTSDSATASASSDSINLTGSTDTGTLTGSGTGNGILEGGSNDTGNLQGSSENASLTGSGDVCTSTGSSNGINLQGGSETGTLEGSGGAITAYNTGTNDTENLQGTGETGTLQASGTLNVSGNSDAGYLQTASDSGSLTGNSDSIYDTGAGSNAIASGSSDSLYLQGTSETGIFSGTGTSNGIQVTGASDAAVLQGTHESATLSGTSDNSTVTGASDGITLSGTSETGTLQATSDTIDITGASDTAYLQGYTQTASLQGSSDSVIDTGNNDVANLQANIDTASLSGSADTADLYSTTETVTSSTNGETINIMATPSSSTDTLDISNDALNSVIQTKFNLSGNDNTITGSYDNMTFSGINNVVDANYSVINDFNAQGDWLDGYNDLYPGGNPNGLYDGPDPIVLNLTGQQVQTVGLAQSNTYFDMENTGQRILTGWVTPGEGLLVYDPNNTNTVTDDANLVSSFSQLQSLDSNHDGVLNSQDASWSQLKVWVDQAGEGNFTSSTLYTLAQLGITSIDLNATASSPTAASPNPNNNTIVSTSTFTLASGGTGDMAAVIFADAPSIGTGSNAASGQLTASQFNQIVAATAAYNPTPLSGTSSSLVANDNGSQNMQLAAGH